MSMNLFGVFEEKIWIKFALAYLSLMEKAMAPLSSILAWKIPGTGEPGGLPSVGLHRVRHN